MKVEKAEGERERQGSGVFVLEVLAAYLGHMCTEFGSSKPNERHIVPQKCSVCTCAHGKEPACLEKHDPQRPKKKKRKEKPQMEFDAFGQPAMPSLVLKQKKCQ